MSWCQHRTGMFVWRTLHCTTAPPSPTALPPPLWQLWTWMLQGLLFPQLVELFNIIEGKEEKAFVCSYSSLRSMMVAQRSSLFTFCRAEQVIASLIDLVKQQLSTLHSQQPAVSDVKCSLLSTITSLLLQKDFLVRKYSSLLPLFSQLSPLNAQQCQLLWFQTENVTVFQQVVELLLDIICQSNHPTDKQVRSTACQCMEQLETLCPVRTITFFQEKIERRVRAGHLSRTQKQFQKFRIFPAEVSTWNLHTPNTFAPQSSWAGWMSWFESNF